MKRNWMINLGFFIGSFGYYYQEYGFIRAVKNSIFSISLSIIKWYYNNVKFVNKYIKKKFKDRGGDLLADLIFSNKPFDYKGFYNSLSDEQKKKWKENSEQILEKTVKDANIENKDEINKLRKMINFEDENI